MSLPVNPWAHCGDLLIDQDYRQDSTFDQLVESIKSLPVAFLSLEWVYETEDWQRLIEALADSGCSVFRRPQFNVGIVEIEGSWEAYFDSLSKNPSQKNANRPIDDSANWEWFSSLDTIDLIRVSKFPISSIKHGRSKTLDGNRWNHPR